jgi:phospholipid transport system transporter-binding protein
LKAAPFELPSAIHFDSLREVRAAGESYLDDQTEDAVFDLSALQECNSAAVALLMAWVRYAHAHDKAVVYAHAPAELMNIIKVVGLADTLPVRQQDRAQA